MSAESLSVVICSDALSGEMELVENNVPFERCLQNIRKPEIRIPFVWCITNFEKLNSYASFKSPLFRIDPSGKRTFRMELELEPHRSYMEVRLFLNRGLEKFGQKVFCICLSRYVVTETDGMLEEIERLQVIFKHQIRSLIFDDFNVQTAQVEMDLFVIHIETNPTVATRSSLPSGSSSGGGGASAASPPDNRMLKLSMDMECLLRSANFADVALCSEGRDIRAYRGILSQRSSVFERMFNHPMKESQDGRVVIEDVAFDTLQRLVAYMYSSRLTEPLTYESAMALFVAANKYDIAELRDICAEVIVENLSVENCVEVAILADTHVNVRLRDASAAVLAAHHREIWRQQDNSERLKARPDVMKVLLDVISAEQDSD